MQRVRRHTIARPASALRLLSTDVDTDNEDDDTQQNQIDRISDMLSILIQEANEAVNYKKELKPTTSSTTTIISRKQQQNASLDTYPLNVPQRKRLSRPISFPSSRRLTKRRSNTVIITQEPSSVQMAKPSSLRRSLTPGNKSLTGRNDHMIQTSPLAESFKRLDSSLAVVDSLSRDLAVSTVSIPPTPPHTPPPPTTTVTVTTTTDDNNNKRYNKELISAFQILSFDSRLSVFLLLPLLHLPHAFISVVFDSFLSYDDHTDSASSFTGILMWIVMFGLTNIMADQNTLNPMVKQGKRKLLPGTFALDHTRKIRRSSKSKIRQDVVVMKRRHSF